MLNMKEMKTSIDAKWVGPCKPGQQPGDVTLETGQTINIKQMMQAARSNKQRRTTLAPVAQTGGWQLDQRRKAPK